MLDLSPEEINTLLASLPSLPVAEQEKLLADLDALAEKKAVKQAQDDFLAPQVYETDTTSVQR